MDDAVAGHLRLEQLYREKLAESSARAYAIEDALEALSDPAQRIIMRERYIYGRSWVRICDMMRSEGYSERQVYRLHGYALLKLKEVKA
jgi:DNA-directed RNA polymerase specialized sigma subunit